MTNPRPHHYRFAHRELPRHLLKFGPQVTSPAPNGGSLVPAFTKLWNSFGETLPPEDRLPSNGLDCRHVEVEGTRLLLVTLPTPAGTTEAYFCASVLPKGANAVRYLTLEHAINPFDGSPGTVLGEWTTESHLNHGPGPSPVADLFVASVVQLVAPKKRGFWRR
ncbi:hypothetical protein ACIG0C_11885 [Kitasatospora aureofaciens]|uniref:Uncharacterized protein n=1 Tax=Kitasatospora aureofaciens TaxID=1894 RepID=A0A1E7MWD7_KITAU|nr:hypothetical protein [Kitasatospora aureofaciens]QEU99442.1 hypothetical protein CP971_09160 [Streptomyces viridifaciens]ARF78226.1 hypothetical protein B6264_04220 [Kitasatospora aureofaciens]OEV32734.1 hypothetical protein HS99_0015865 [Kitasatospora aureofaciens]UKZ05527.1 hypothetical protein BOQ63_016045 [Streptomyces viridifaciens]GGU80794.1 hypothetical protein GCM10010502_36080 [Kitasatospora aureofaciens]